MNAYRENRPLSIGISAKTASALGFLAILELTLYFNNPSHFFQGDTLYWLANPYRSPGEFLRGFIELDPGGWYRPLSQRTVESVLLPFFGLNPVPYRLLTFFLFVFCTISVFFLIGTLTTRWLPTLIGTFFFATHITHAYTTYDVAFTPELLYVSFYIFSAIAWWRYLQQGHRRSAITSLLFFLGSLMSKEAAVTLPAVLVLLWFLTPVRDLRSLRWLAGHFGLLGIYLLFVVGHLGVGGLELSRLVESPARAGLTGYELVIGNNILDSFATAVQWAFGFPAGSHGSWQLPAPWMFRVLHLFRFAVAGACLLSLWSGNRRLILFGVGWFALAAAPMLPLLDHFLPYYLLAPVVGVSLVTGVALSDAYERLSTHLPAATVTLGLLLLVTYAALSAAMIWDAQRTQALLGDSSRRAATAMADMRAMHAKLPSGAILAFLDQQDPGAWWNHAQGGLFQLAYADRSITAQYSTLGFSITESDLSTQRVRYFETAGGRISPYAQYPVMLSRSEVTRGESYSLNVPGLADTELMILYTLDNESKELFRARLDHKGKTTFDVTPQTLPGLYRIVAVKRPEDLAWSLTDAAIVVR